jgi:mannose-1-phosphate guanylyltransferase
MKALLLAAGFGNRLGKLTENKPKPLIEVGGQPILKFCLNQLEEAGVTEVIVNTHYLSDQIVEFLTAYQSPMQITISFEEELLGTAGTLNKHLSKLADGDFLVMHADNYFQSSLKEFVISHNGRKVGKYGTLGTFTTDNPSSCGILVLNQDKTIAELHEKVSNPPGNLANAAVYIFSPIVEPIVRSLQNNENDISKHLIPLLSTGLVTHHFEGVFVDIGTPEGLKKANETYEELKRSTTV